jgi:hypothetical protein
MPAEISVIDVKPRPIAAISVTTELSKWPREFRHSLDKVYAAVKAGHVRQNGQNVMVYRSREDGRVDIECGIEIEQRLDPVGEVHFRETGSNGAHIAPYEELGTSSRTNGYPFTGTRWEIYGDWHEDPMKLRTDIFYLKRP